MNENNTVRGNFKQEIFNTVNENVRALETLFPSVVKDGQVDFKALKEELGQYEEVDEEKYGLSWAGKQKTKKISQEDPIGKTLKFCPQKSHYERDTENLYIEGDNLEVLKLLRQNYYGAIKMIYIDPPYNTEGDFIYNDKFNIETIESDILENDRGFDNERFISNQKSNNRFHANWLNMIYPRLKIAKDLLQEDGVVFISIDDNEVCNLKNVLEEIFGRNNVIAILPTVMNLKGNNDQFGFSGTHEYTVVCCKNKDALELGYLPVGDEKLNDWEEDEYGYFKKGANLKATGVNAPRQKRPNLFFPLYITKDDRVLVERSSEIDIEILPITNNREMSWRWSKSKFVNEPYNLIVSRNEGNISVYKKTRPLGGDEPSQKPKSLFYKPEYSSGNGTNEIKQIFGEKVFSNPKPSSLLKDFFYIGLVEKEPMIILDFFSGSGTAAASIMEFNNTNNTEHKFIMVQAPEKCKEDTDAYNKGYKDICSIGQDRIKIFGQSLKEQNKNIDVGFKVFKVANTNIRWNYEDIKSQASNLLKQETQLQIAATQQMANTQLDIASMMSDKDKLDFMPGFTDIDVVYELLLRQRDIPLSAKVEQLNEVGPRTYLFAQSYLVCLETEITTELLEKIAALQPLPIKFIFRDSAFEDDINLKDETIRRFKAFVARNKGEKQSAYTVEFI